MLKLVQLILILVLLPVGMKAQPVPVPRPDSAEAYEYHKVTAPQRVDNPVGEVIVYDAVGTRPLYRTPQQLDTVRMQSPCRDGEQVSSPDTLWVWRRVFHVEDKFTQGEMVAKFGYEREELVPVGVIVYDSTIESRDDGSFYRPLRILTNVERKVKWFSDCLWQF